MVQKRERVHPHYGPRDAEFQRLLGVRRRHGPLARGYANQAVSPGERLPKPLLQPSRKALLAWNLEWPAAR